jgi:hypothetical protein
MAESFPLNPDVLLHQEGDKIELHPNNMNRMDGNPDILHQEGDKIELHPNNMNRKDGICLSKSWMLLIYSKVMEEISC